MADKDRRIHTYRREEDRRLERASEAAAASDRKSLDSMLGTYCPSGERLDAAIDAATHSRNECSTNQGEIMKFPKQIFVKWEDDGDEKWLVAQETAAGIVEADETVTVGIYQLIRTTKASAETKID